MADQAATAPLSTIPKTWPGGFGAYKHSKQAIRNVLLNIVILYLATVVIGFIIGLITGNNKGLYFVGQIVSNVISIIASTMIVVLYLAGGRDIRMSVQESWEKAKPYIIRFFFLTIVLSFIAIGSLLLFIIPFFIIMPRLFMSQYFLIDKKLGVFDSISASWDQTKGHVGKIWGIIGVGLVFVLLAFTIIGIPFAIYFSIMYSAVTVVLYYFITDNNKAPEAVSAESAEAKA